MGSKPKDQYNENSALSLESGKARIPVYVLTEVGFAIASILPDNQSNAFEQCANCFEKDVIADWVRRYKPLGDGFALVSETRLSPPQ
jgi:hypothetical protein